MTESFEDARIFAQAIISDCDIPLLDSMKRAHEHEMEQLRRLRFREGYEAGQRSMDAEHYQLKLRLQGLKFGDGSHENLSRLAYAIYPCPTGWGKESCEGLRDKLIELLGGVSDGSSTPSPTACGACDADCDCGHGNKTAVASCGQSHESSHMSLENETGITDELREFVESEYSETIEWYQHPQTLIALADRIDEQFKRICWQQEAVLQHTIDEMIEERDNLRTMLTQQRDEARAKVLRLDNEISELQRTLREIAERAGVPHDIDLDEYGDDLVAKATLGKIDSTHEHIGALEWQRDRQKKLLDEYDKMHVELPKDADGKCIHSGDLLEPATLSAARHLRSNPFEAKLFYGYLDGRYGINLSAPLDGGDAAVSPRSFRHATPDQRVESDADTAEDIVRDIHLGKVTDSEAVERIRALP